MDNHTSVGPPTERTLKNVRRARAHSLWAGPVHLEWKFWTGVFKFWPRWEVMTTEFWNEGPVRWFRCYWLVCGISLYKALPERRMTYVNGIGATSEDVWERTGHIQRRGKGISQ